MLSLSNLWQVQGSRKLWLRDGPLENLWGGGGGGGGVTKKKIFMLWPKKNSYKEFDNEN